MIHNALQCGFGYPPAIMIQTDLPKDDKDIAGWAREATLELYRHGTISGSNGYIRPSGIATRAEAAQMLYNLLLSER